MGYLLGMWIMKGVRFLNRFEEAVESVLVKGNRGTWGANRMILAVSERGVGVA